MLWPVHCVQDTPGAEFHPKLDRAGIHHVIQKGTDPAIDSYSGFFDNGHRQATGLAELLQARGVTAVDVMGLALDYCVKFTALDAVKLGLTTTLLTEGCRVGEPRPRRRRPGGGGDAKRWRNDCSGEIGNDRTTSPPDWISVN